MAPQGYSNQGPRVHSEQASPVASNQGSGGHSEQASPVASNDQQWEEDSIVVTDDRVGITFDPYDQEDREHESDEGLNIIMRPISREEACEIMWFIPACR
jgi:hypothetical protein